ncbi:MAG: M56 family metallopeptidase [Streptosporangiaceae bacterium]|jgi:Zn-dependent protease with chaperone function
MIPALAVVGSAIVMAWFLPLPLGRLGRDGVSPRLGIAAWLTAIASVLALALAALGLLARSAVSGWPTFARTVCESVTTGVCPPAVYRSAAYELGLAAVAFAGGITLIVLGCRYGRSLRRTSVSTREHAEAARIVGQRGAGDAAFVLDAARPAVYCLPGRPPTIVVTTGALAVLQPGQLTAVLAHERAHLAARHHLLLAVTRSLAAVAPFVPIFARGSAEVARLAEMRADDAAAARCGGEQGRRTLLTALLAMAAGVTAAPAPASWLPATGGVVAARVRRLASPPAPGRLACYGLALAALTLAVAAVAVLVPAAAMTGL